MRGLLVESLIESLILSMIEELGSALGVRRWSLLRSAHSPEDTFATPRYIIIER